MTSVQKRMLAATGPERTASIAAVTTATGAVVCGVCCVRPFAFRAVAAAGTGSLLAWFAEAHSWATASWATARNGVQKAFVN